MMSSAAWHSVSSRYERRKLLVYLGTTVASGVLRSNREHRRLWQLLRQQRLVLEQLRCGRILRERGHRPLALAEQSDVHEDAQTKLAAIDSQVFQKLLAMRGDSWMLVLRTWALLVRVRGDFFHSLSGTQARVSTALGVEGGVTHASLPAVDEMLKVAKRLHTMMSPKRMWSLG